MRSVFRKPRPLLYAPLRRVSPAGDFGVYAARDKLAELLLIPGVEVVGVRPRSRRDPIAHRRPIALGGVVAHTHPQARYGPRVRGGAPAVRPREAQMRRVVG